MTSLERMDEKLRRLRMAGRKIVGEKLRIKYAQKGQTREQAYVEVARQNKWDKRHDKETEQ